MTRYETIYGTGCKVRVHTRRKLRVKHIKNKLCAIGLFMLGLITLIVSGLAGQMDGTVFIFTTFTSIGLFFARKNYIDI